MVVKTDDEIIKTLENYQQHVILIVKTKRTKRISPFTLVLTRKSKILLSGPVRICLLFVMLFVSNGI